MAKKGRPKQKIEVEKNFSIVNMKPTPKIKKGRFAPHEESYIRGHYTVMSDREIGEFLNREAAAITRKRQSMLLGKNQGRPSNSSKAEAYKSKSDRQIDREMYDTLSREEKKILFKKKFENTERYRQLTAILTPDELKAYIESFLDYMFQFETILKHEEDTLHLAVLEMIRQQRFLQSQVHVRDAIQSGDRTAVLTGRLEILDRRYKESVELYDKLMSSLHATRDQRLKNKEENRVSLVTVVQALQDEEARRLAGEEAAMIKAAKEYAGTIMRNNGHLLD
jgi:hypothetical protein